jgi:O-antigen/teichoic acid export membrane protein
LLATAANVLINRADAALVGLAAGSSVSGIYAPASTIENAVTTLALIPTASALTHIGRASAGSVRSLVRTYLAWAAGLATAGGLLVVVASPLLPAVLGQDFSTSSPTTRIVMLGAPLSVAAAVYSAALVAQGRMWAVAQAWIAAGVVAVASQFVLAGALGATGAAMGSVLRDAALAVAMGALFYHGRVQSGKSVSDRGAGERGRGEG